ncbi:MAG: DUF1963 domain-containing protein [Gordonia sp. (in: high G+C Gram-positive bacteria)]
MSLQIDEFLPILARPHSALTAGGFRPTGADDESWIGRVFLFRADDDVPLSESGRPLIPLAQLHIPSLPARSDLLDGIEILTVFVSDPLPDPLAPMGPDWVVREYRPGDELVGKDVPVRTPLKPFPVRVEPGAADHPLWDGGGMPDAVQRRIVEHDLIDDYFADSSHRRGHKVGGWPSFCQAGEHPGDGFEFVFQIDSDEKVGLNVVDGGTLTFWKHRDDGRWALYYDFL